MKRIVIIAALVVALTAALTAGAGEQTAPLSTAELQKTIGAGKKSTLVFFINPQGGPCRAQKEIVEKLQKDRKGNFNVAYVSTMKQEDQRAFYEWGVRSLPQLVVVDSKGKIAKYFPPGVQSPEVLSQALDASK